MSLQEVKGPRKRENEVEKRRQANGKMRKKKKARQLLLKRSLLFLILKLCLNNLWKMKLRKSKLLNKVLIFAYLYCY